MSTMAFGPKTHHPISLAFARADCLIQNHAGVAQKGETPTPSEALSPLADRIAAYKIFIHGSLNSLRLKTIILTKGELVFDKESQILLLGW